MGETNWSKEGGGGGFVLCLPPRLVPDPYRKDWSVLFDWDGRSCFLFNDCACVNQLNYPEPSFELHSVVKRLTTSLMDNIRDACP